MANTFVNKKVDLTSTSATTLYTVPTATTAVIKSILVSDDSGSGDTITITLTDTDASVFSRVEIRLCIAYHLLVAWPVGDVAARPPDCDQRRGPPGVHRSSVDPTRPP